MLQRMVRWTLRWEETFSILSTSRLSSWFNSLLYSHGKDVSLGQTISAIDLKTW